MERSDHTPRSERGGIAAPDETRALGNILDDMVDLEEGGEVSVNQVLEAFSDRSTGALITVVGLLAALPVIGAIPGVSITTGAFLILLVVRSAFGDGTVTIPGRLGRLSIKQKTLERGVDAFRPVARWIDDHTGARLETFSRSKPARMTIKASVAVLAATMFPLAFVPWGVTPPAFGIVALGLALVARDGILALIGYGFLLATAAIGLWAVI